MKPKALILRSAGTNCDAETQYAFELAGAEAQRLHINRLLREPSLLDSFQILAIPGGFSYGDDIAAGRILANQISHHLADPLRRFVETGRPVIGICNGFQVLVKTNLLPGPIAGRSGQACTLTNNDCGRFIDRWIRLAPRPSKCIWTSGLEQQQMGVTSPFAAGAPTLELPVAHGEGKFIPAEESVRQALWSNGQVPLIYAAPDGAPASGQFPDNPNGSVDDIAGICDASGLVFGLMPHPERYVDALQHPGWTRSPPLSREGHGLRIFVNALRHVRDAVGVGI